VLPICPWMAEPAPSERCSLHCEADPNASLGSMLLRETLQHCDRDSVIASLESSNPRIPFYELHGFKRIGLIGVDGSLRLSDAPFHKISCGLVKSSSCACSGFGPFCGIGGTPRVSLRTGRCVKAQSGRTRRKRIPSPVGGYCTQPWGNRRRCASRAIAVYWAARSHEPARI
jgi:hypothetical protein